MNGLIYITETLGFREFRKHYFAVNETNIQNLPLLCNYLANICFVLYNPSTQVVILQAIKV